MWSKQLYSFARWWDGPGDWQESLTIEQTGVNSNGIVMTCTRWMKCLNAYPISATLILSYGNETSQAVLDGFSPDPGFRQEKTVTTEFTVPSSWAGKTISWEIELRRSGNIVFAKLPDSPPGITNPNADRTTIADKNIAFGTYGQFKLTITADNSSATVERLTSPNKGAAAGKLSNGAAIYTGDTIKVTSKTGYKLEINSKVSTSGSTVTVSGDVIVKTSPQATIHLYEGGKWVPYLIYVYSGTKWELHQLHINNGSKWEPYY